MREIVEIRDLATVITNLLSAIPWIGTDLVEFIYLLFISLFTLAILPTIGSVNYKALRGRAPRTENEKRYALNIPFDFLGMDIFLLLKHQVVSFVFSLSSL